MRETLPPHTTEPTEPHVDRDEIVLTQEDRERITSVLKSIHHHGSLFSPPDEHGAALRTSLRAEGDKAAALLVELIQTEGDFLRIVGPEDEGWQSNLSFFVAALSLCASPRWATEISLLLTTDEIATSSDRTSKTELLNILTRIGTAETARKIYDFATTSWTSDYTWGGSYYHETDLHLAYQTLIAIEIRATTETERLKVRRERLEINHLLYERSLPRVTVSEEKKMRSQCTPTELERGFEKNFVPESEWNQDEQNEDAAIEDAYRQSKWNEVKDRLGTVMRLRHEARKERDISEPPEEDDDRFLRRHWLEYREEHSSPYAPTLGIEIEVRKSTALPNTTGMDLLEAEELRRQTLGKYETAAALGVPKGHDIYPLWEFSHEPSRHYFTLTREVQALIELELIKKTYRKHPLHLTIGRVFGVPSDFHGMPLLSSARPGATEALVLARALESTGWSTSSGRLLLPYLTKKDAWTIKGCAGTFDRGQGEQWDKKLRLDVKDAVEIRTFQLQSLTGLNRLLRSAYFLGAALRAYQERETYAPLAEGVDEATRFKLATLWKDFSTQLHEIFQTHGLPIPSSVWTQPNRTDKTMQGGFVGMAHLLDEARKDLSSQSAQFTREVKKLIIHTRGQIAKLIEVSPSNARQNEEE